MSKFTITRSTGMVGVAQNDAVYLMVNLWINLRMMKVKRCLLRETVLNYRLDKVL